VNKEKMIFITFPVSWFLASLFWHFFITNKGFSGVETSSIFLVFYYFSWSINYLYFKPKE